MPEVLEGEFKQLDWSNPLNKPSLAVELAADSKLRITLSPDASEDGEELIAIWTRPGPQLGATTSITVRRSKPLHNGEQALSLLNAFARGDDGFESLVEWLDKAPDSAN